MTCRRCDGTGLRDDDPDGLCLACDGDGDGDEEEDEW